MARYAFTDIHGCLKTFRVLLDKINLQPQDELFFLGDYISRGPDSKGVVQKIRQLEREQRKVIVLRGNHEQMLVSGDEYDPVPGGWSPAEMRWFKNLPYFHLEEDYVLVHAGLNFKTGTDPLLDQASMLWIRYWEADLDLQWLDGRQILYGHTPQSYTDTQKQIQFNSPVICLDTGCVHHSSRLGYLTVFNMDTKEAFFQRRID